MAQFSSVVSLSVTGYCGSFCVACEDGEILRARIQSALSANQTVALSFAGVQSLSAAFLRSALGELLAIHSAEDLDDFLKIEDIGEADKNLLFRVLVNAKIYYADPEKYHRFLRALEDDCF